MARIVREKRFYDGGSLSGEEEPDRDAEPQIKLKRFVAHKVSWLSQLFGMNRETETFLLERKIGYAARCDSESELRILVPSDDDFGREPAARFRSDLTSVPNVFTWLIPRSGQHLPAAIVHDGLICDPGEPASYSARRVQADGQSEPVTVRRIDADRIFRDAMFDLGVSWVRRWLMWSAVTLATVATGTNDAAPSGQTSGRTEVVRKRSTKDSVGNLYYRVVVFGTLAVVVALGLVAFADVFDWWNVLPWMGTNDTGWELLFAALAAFVVPAVLSILWWKLWPAGVITGVSLSVCLYPTLILLALTTLFAVLDYATRNRTEPVRV